MDKVNKNREHKGNGVHCFLFICFNFAEKEHALNKSFLSSYKTYKR